MCREFDRQKHSQREFKKTMAENVDKLKQESETKVTIVLEMCELQMYEPQLKIWSSCKCTSHN
jgi:predicted HicB family RNase H-like nuclease